MKKEKLDLARNPLQDVENPPVFTALGLNPDGLGQLLNVGEDGGAVASLETLRPDNHNRPLG